MKVRRQNITNKYKWHNKDKSRPFFIGCYIAQSYLKYRVNCEIETFPKAQFACILKKIKTLMNFCF